MNYFERAHLPRFGEIARGNKAMASTFFAWYGLATGPGALPVPTKCLVALAVAHALPCVYCIDAYTSNCMENGLDLEEMTSAVHIAALVKASGVMAHGRQMAQQALAASMGADMAPPSSVYYAADQNAFDNQLRDASPAAGAALDAWSSAVVEESALDRLQTIVVATGVAHAMQCPYSIERWTAAALADGVTTEELIEAVQVAAAIRGGAALVTSLQMLDQIDRQSM
jgi:4-carboxymuconolactone decarboxylase